MSNDDNVAAGPAVQSIPLWLTVTSVESAVRHGKPDSVTHLAPPESWPIRRK